MFSQCNQIHNYNLRLFNIYPYRYCVPESPRWLLARGRLDELYAIVERAARFNGITLPANYKKALEAAVPTSSCVDSTDASASACGGEAATIIKGNSKIPEVQSPLVVVFSKTYLRTTCLTLVVWLTLIIIYFGLTLHLSNLGGNIYVNTVSHQNHCPLAYTFDIRWVVDFFVDISKFIWMSLITTLFENCILTE